MAQYCDSQRLERNWFYWLLSSRVPDLELYRKLGLLWTKISGQATDGDGNPITRHGKTLPDPSHPARSHCIALATPIFFDSYDGVLKQCGTAYFDGKPVDLPFPAADDLTLLSDSAYHRLDCPLIQLTQVIPALTADGYLKELPTTDTWHLVLEDINKMCFGIAMKFKPRTEEEHHELTQEALIQVIGKLHTYKLVYTPGRAPVFNLLTTTIHRVMYSIMNRRKNQREGLGRMLADAEAGVLPDSNRSLRVQCGGKANSRK